MNLHTFQISSNIFYFTINFYILLFTFNVPLLIVIFLFHGNTASWPISYAAEMLIAKMLQ